jgi:hypothetical protein
MPLPSRGLGALASLGSRHRHVVVLLCTSVRVTSSQAAHALQAAAGTGSACT